MSRSAMVPKTSNQGRLFRILPLAGVAVVLVLIGGPGKLAELPPLARWGLFACMVFAFLRADATRQLLRRTIRPCSADPCSQSLRSNFLESPFDSLYLLLRGRNDKLRLVLR